MVLLLLSALDRRCDRLRALRIDGQVRGKRDQGVAAERGIRKALLAEAVVQALLHAPHLAVRDAICGPRRETDAVARVLRQVRQVLQTDALAILAMAGS